MKIAISGKGGVGKTTLSGMLSGVLGLEDRRVIAIDADPDANLASALGVPDETRVVPLAEMHDMIAERTGAADEPGGYFQLNPRVDDIPDEYALKIGNIRMLALGGVAQGGGGCICPATAIVKALLVHLIIGRGDILIMDMEAGLEHLGRATAQSMDALVVVVNPDKWSVQTAVRVRDLAGDLGMKKVFAVVNRLGIAGQDDRDDTQAKLEQIQTVLGDVPLIGSLPMDPRFGEGALRIDPDGGVTPTEALTAHRAAVEGIIAELRSRV
ncbi:MAG: AAA family ATPase [Phycisphaerae bacterium]|jgi:CO dehydrogenase maturation factor|nr:AAA family ATPase [Phycisphaerae bacterium]